MTSIFRPRILPRTRRERKFFAPSPFSLLVYDGLSNQAYVDKLEQTAGIALSNKAQLVADLDQMTKTRA
jgi:hypothetical protein